MSSFGYDGDISNTPSSGESTFGQNFDDGTSSALTHFVHGMHSFNTASQLQFYMERMAAPEARVNITVVGHVPSRTQYSSVTNHNFNSSASLTPLSSSQLAVLSLSPVFTPAPPVPLAPPPSPVVAYLSGGNRLTHSQQAGALATSSAPVVAGQAMENFRTNPTPPGYDRRYIMVKCHLHDRVGTPEQVGHDEPVLNPFGSAGSGPRYSQGYCNICRSVVRVDPHSLL